MQRFVVRSFSCRPPCALRHFRSGLLLIAGTLRGRLRYVIFDAGAGAWAVAITRSAGITDANIDKVKDLISPGLEWCIKHGFLSP